jgi:hypothetical protein
MIPIEGGKLSTLSFCTAIFSNFHFSFLDRKLNESLWRKQEVKGAMVHLLVLIFKEVLGCSGQIFSF